MKTQVPEETATVTLDRLLLRPELTRNRGRLQKLVPFLEEMLFDEGSPWHGNTPSQIDFKLRALLPDIPPLMRILAQLIRQGDENLAQGVLSALATKDHLIPGEQPADSKLVPVTVFMLDPDKTLVLLEWFQRVVYTNRLVAKDLGDSDWERRTKELNERLLQAYPSLEKLLQVDILIRGSMDDFYLKEGYPLRLAQIQDALLPLQPHLINLGRTCISPQKVLDRTTFLTPLRIEFHPLSGARDSIPTDINWHSLNGREFRNFSMVYKDVYHQEPPSGCEAFSQAFLFAAFGREQGEILSCLPRKLQDKLATWQFKLPASLIQHGHPQLVVGLHNKEAHEQWQKRWPMFVAAGSNHELSAIAFPTANSQNLRVHEDAVTEYREAYRNWRQEPNGCQYHVFTT